MEVLQKSPRNKGESWVEQNYSNHSQSIRVNSSKYQCEPSILNTSRDEYKLLKIPIRKL